MIYYADDTAPVQAVQLDALAIGMVLTLSLLLSVPAAYLGGWLRSLLLPRLTD